MTHSEPTNSSGETGSSTGANPIYDVRRLDALSKFDRDTLRSDDILRSIVDEACERLGLPISLVSFVLDQAQLFPVSRGLSGWLEDVGGTPVEWSFCANAVRDEAPFVVEDATTNERVRHIPLVDQEGIRCYAGIPLRASDGSILGTLCVIGREPRTFTTDDMATLQRLADRAASRLAELADA